MNINDVFGQITPPPGSASLTDPGQGSSTLLSVAIRLIFVGGGLTGAGYLFWGAFDYLTSGGEKENIQKAQQKMTAAIIGLVLLVVVLVAWGVIGGDILGIIRRAPNGNWMLILPSIKQ